MGIENHGNEYKSNLILWVRREKGKRPLSACAFERPGGYWKKSKGFFNFRRSWEI